MPPLPTVKLPALFYWRAQRMLSRPELAELANLSSYGIYTLEHESRARLSTVLRLADALGVEPSALTDPPPAFNDGIVTPPALHRHSSRR